MAHSVIMNMLYMDINTKKLYQEEINEDELDEGVEVGKVLQLRNGKQVIQFYR